MATLFLQSLRCLDEQEGGGDEIYLKFKDNGGSGTGKSAVHSGMDTGDFRSIGGAFSFNGSVKLTMMEQDGFLNPDDTIQAFNVSAPGSYTTTFTGDGAKYELKYLIV